MLIYIYYEIIVLIINLHVKYHIFVVPLNVSSIIFSNFW